MSYTIDPEIILELKNFLYLFSITLESYNYDVTEV